MTCQKHFDEYLDLSDAERKKIECKYSPKKLFLKAYNYNVWFENEKSTDGKDSVDLSDMPPQRVMQKEKQEKDSKF